MARGHRATLQKQRENSLKVIRFFFKPYLGQFTILLILSVLIGVLEAASIAAVYPMLNTAFQNGAAQENIVINTFQQIARLLPISDPFIAYATIFLITALLGFIIKYFAIKYRIQFSACMIGDNQLEVFRRFMKADYQYFVDHKQGEILYDVTTAPHRLSGLAMSATELVSQIILSIAIIVLLLALSWAASIIVLLLGLSYYYFTRYLGVKIAYHASQGEMGALQEANVILNEAINGAKQVKVFAVEDDWIDRYRTSLDKRWFHYIRQGIWRQVPPPALLFILYMAVGISGILIKALSPTSFVNLLPVFGTFTFAVFRLVPIMGSMGDIIMSISGSMPDCETVYHILTERLTNITDGTRPVESFRSAVKFNNVSFAYKGRQKTLENLTVSFERGKTTAIVGRSGSGKSSILGLLLRLFEPDSGTIEVDGVNIKELRLPSWLNRIGFVSQDTFIFNDTIKNNITFHSPEYSDEEVMKAAEYAEAHSFIQEMPQRYDTVAGDRGIRLSGGQSQRIAIARAMIRQPEILIFDEATNSLDNISEAAVQKAIDKVARDHTVIIVAHRLSTIANADKIIVLGDGKMLEQGTHQELLARKGAYWQLYNTQVDLV